jgi:hypothetical protein
MADGREYFFPGPGSSLLGVLGLLGGGAVGRWKCRGWNVLESGSSFFGRSVWNPLGLLGVLGLLGC